MKAPARPAPDAARTGPIVPLLVFEAAGCPMALPAAEVAGLVRSGEPGAAAAEGAGTVDLTEYLTGRRCSGPWVRWRRGDRRTLLRMERVVEVVPCAVRALTPLPAWLREQPRIGLFWAAGVRGDEVFLLVDPARLGGVGGTTR